MSRRLPRFATWLLAGVFAAISVAGQGLHYLQHHADHFACPPTTTAAAVACPHHAANHADRSHDGQCHGGAVRDPADGGRRHGHDHDDCLICRYFAQQQLSPMAATASVERLALQFVRVKRAAAPLTSDAEPYEARGPPQSAVGSC